MRRHRVLEASYVAGDRKAHAVAMAAGSEMKSLGGGIVAVGLDFEFHDGQTPMPTDGFPPSIYAQAPPSSRTRYGLETLVGEHGLEPWTR